MTTIKNVNSKRISAALWTVQALLAAAGLVIIMIGATALTAPAGFGPAIGPLVIGLLALFVAWGRSEVAPHPPRSARAIVQGS